MVPLSTLPGLCALLLVWASASAYAAPVRVSLRDGTQHADLPAVLQLGSSAVDAMSFGKSLQIAHRRLVLGSWLSRHSSWLEHSRLSQLLSPLRLCPVLLLRRGGHQPTPPSVL